MGISELQDLFNYEKVNSSVLSFGGQRFAIGTMVMSQVEPSETLLPLVWQVIAVTAFAVAEEHLVNGVGIKVNNKFSANFSDGILQSTTNANPGQTARGSVFALAPSSKALTQNFEGLIKVSPVKYVRSFVPDADGNLADETYVLPAMNGADPKQCDGRVLMIERVGMGKQLGDAAKEVFASELLSDKPSVRQALPHIQRIFAQVVGISKPIIAGGSVWKPPHPLLVGTQSSPVMP